MSTGENIDIFLHRQRESVPLSSLWVGSGEPIRGCSEITWYEAFKTQKPANHRARRKHVGCESRAMALGQGDEAGGRGQPVLHGLQADLTTRSFVVKCTAGMFCALSLGMFT